MAHEVSSDIEDVGRKESERLLRDTKQAKYLDDVLEQNERDHREVIEKIEQRRQQIGEKTDDAFLRSIDALVADAIPSEEQQDGPSNRNRNVDTLLVATDTLLKLHHKANHCIADVNNSANEGAAYGSAREEERRRVKEILAAGKRVFEGELRAVEQIQQQQSKRGDESEEVAAQAIALFGEGAQQADEESEAKKTLKFVEKGVRKMTRGLGSET